MKKEEMIIEFLRCNENISINKMEKELGLANRTVRTDGSRGISDKYIEMIENYLKPFGYDSGITPLKKEEIRKDNSDTSAVVKKIWNEGWILGYDDKIYRYKDEEGLMRRLEPKDYLPEVDSKEKEVEKKWQPQDESVYNDEIGEFYIAKNGIKVYTRYKYKKHIKRENFKKGSTKIKDEI